MSGTTVAEPKAALSGPPVLASFAHCSLPCRDMAEGKRFYVDVLGGTMRVNTPTFAMFIIGCVEIGIGNEGCTFIQPETEYPHIAFYADPDQMLHMKAWLTACGIPSSNFWTRQGVEALMFFRDPSGNMIELFCVKPFPGADQLPRSGPAAATGKAVNLDSFRYDTWKLPEGYTSRVPV
jgi:catechol 2,3-dioxygenase-like lactoylglutathione lyase family enzyme